MKGLEQFSLEKGGCCQVAHTSIALKERRWRRLEGKGMQGVTRLSRAKWFLGSSSNGFASCSIDETDKCSCHKAARQVMNERHEGTVTQFSMSFP